jgi:hypothetical protein
MPVIGCTMGHTKCSNITGMVCLTFFMRHLSVYVVLAVASSWIESTFIACLVTTLCRAPRGMEMYGVCGVISFIRCERRLTPCLLSCLSTLFCPTTKRCRVFWSITSMRCIAGTAPGVLFLVCCQCKCGVFFNIRLAVGFWAFIIGGAFEMRGIVRMGSSSISNCCSSLTLCSCP